MILDYKGPMEFPPALFLFQNNLSRLLNADLRLHPLGGNRLRSFDGGTDSPVNYELRKHTHGTRDREQNGIVRELLHAEIV